MVIQRRQPKKNIYISIRQRLLQLTFNSQGLLPTRSTSVSSSKTIIIWDVNTCEFKMTLQDHTESVAFNGHFFLVNILKQKNN